MASIRLRNAKYHVQVRRKDQPSVTKSFCHRKDAEVWARQMEILADRNELPNHSKATGNITLGDLVDRYLREITPKKAGAVTERIVLRAFLRHSIAGKELSKIRNKDFASYRDQRLEHIKPQTLKRQLNPLHHMFEIARDEWGVPIVENPLDKLRLKFIDQRRERRLKEGELDRIISEAQKCKNPYVVPVIMFAVETAMRRGEILGVHWDHIDWKHRSVVIPVSKNGYSRVIPLTPKALRTLEELRKGISNGIGVSVATFSLSSPHSKELSGIERKERENDQTCPQSDTVVFPVTANALRLNWERLKKRAEIVDLHFHDLRHEAISRFFEMGLTVPEVALISGHRDPRMLLRYAHGDTKVVQRKLGNCTYAT